MGQKQEECLFLKSREKGQIRKEWKPWEWEKLNNLLLI